MPAPSDFQRKLDSIEGLIQGIESASDPHVRNNVKELVQLLMDLYGAGLERIMSVLDSSGLAGQSAIDKLGRDELVSSLLVLHGLHPLSVEERLAQALDRIAPSLKKRGGQIELLHFTEGVVKLRLQANGHAAALKELVEEAVYQAAPDLISLTIEGPEERQGFVPLEMLRNSLVATAKGAV